MPQVGSEPAAMLKIMTVDSNSPNQESHKQSDAQPERRPISLLLFLKAENVRLRQVVVELSLDVLALREALKRIEDPSAGSSPMVD